MKTYTIDCAKWRTGKRGKFRTGEGVTRLRNHEGCYCCLGFITAQETGRLGAPKAAFNAIATPEFYSDTNQVTIPGLTRPHSLIKGDWRNTLFSTDAMHINDDEETTPRQKVRLLRQLAKGVGIKLIFKGFNKLPKHPQDRKL